MPQVETTAGPIDADADGTHARATSTCSRRARPSASSTRTSTTRTRSSSARSSRSAARWGTACARSSTRRAWTSRATRASPRASAEETGVQLVMCTGIYGQHYTFLPHHFQTRDEDYLADAFVHDIEVGIQGTAVKAAFIKTAADEPGHHARRREGPPRRGAREPAHRRADHGPLAAGQPHRPRADADLHRGGRRAREGQIAHTGDTDDLDHIEELLATGAVHRHGPLRHGDLPARRPAQRRPSSSSSGAATPTASSSGATRWRTWTGSRPSS